MLNRYFIRVSISALLLSLVSATSVWGQESGTFVRDTIHLALSFRQGSDKIDPSFDGNAGRMAEFEKAAALLLSETGVTVKSAVISPWGTFRRKSDGSIQRRRQEPVAAYVESVTKAPKGTVKMSAPKPQQRWDELRYALSATDYSWKDEVLAILDSAPSVIIGREGEPIDNRFSTLKTMRNGEVWKEMEEGLLPLFDQEMSAVVVVTIPVKAYKGAIIEKEVVYIDRVVRDTVYLDSSEKGKKNANAVMADFSGKRILGSVKTNAIAIPFVNLGIEIPIGRHFSVGGDIYYPWLRRQSANKTCTQLQAFDVEARYWFTGKNSPKGATLAGHSIGVYFAMGTYDFERDWSGYQGRFTNYGIDYKYAFRIFKGHLRLELEIGFGYIGSLAQPYDVFEPGGKAYVREGMKKQVAWYGPTRAQVSIAYPILIKTRAK